MPEEEVECLYKALVDNVVTDKQIILVCKILLNLLKVVE